MLSSKLKSSRLLKLYNQLSVDQRKAFLKLQFLIVFSASLELISISSLVPLLSILSDSQGSKQTSFIEDFIFEYFSDNVIVIASGTISLLCISVVISIYTLWRLSIFTQLIAANIASRLFKFYMFRELEQSVNDNSSRMLSNVIQEVTRLRDYVILPFMLLLAKLSVAIMLILALFVYDFYVALFSGGFLIILYFLIYRTIRSNLFGIGRIITEKNQMVVSRINDAFLALRELHIRNGRERAVSELSIELDNLGMMRGKLTVLGQLPKHLVEFLALGSIGVFSIYLALTHSSGDANIFSEMAIYAIAGFKILPAIQHIFGNVVQIRSNIQSYDAIHNDLSMENELSLRLSYLNENHTTNILPFEKNIQLKDVSYWFDNEKQKVIKNVNLQINRGETVAIVGASGSGKSTLLDLIIGIRQPKIGTVHVDGTEINDTNLGSWFANVSLMPQQSFLLDDTVRENIAFGSDGNQIDDEKINSTIEQVGLSSAITKSSDGIYSRIGERGGLFSGGERQRIGIARLLYQDAPVIFIDEATSALDQKSELEIHACLELLDNKTIVFITHQLSTIRKCDKIIIVDDGKIIGFGSYYELIKSNPIFQKMINSKN